MKAVSEKYRHALVRKASSCVDRIAAAEIDLPEVIQNVLVATSKDACLYQSESCDFNLKQRIEKHVNDQRQDSDEVLMQALGDVRNALNSMHSVGWVHGDVQDSNVVWCSGVWKLIDLEDSQPHGDGYVTASDGALTLTELRAHKTAYHRNYREEGGQEMTIKNYKEIEPTTCPLDSTHSPICSDDPHHPCLYEDECYRLDGRDPKPTGDEAEPRLASFQVPHKSLGLRRFRLSNDVLEYKRVAAKIVAACMSTDMRSYFDNYDALFEGCQDADTVDAVFEHFQTRMSGGGDVHNVSTFGSIDELLDFVHDRYDVSPLLEGYEKADDEMLDRACGDGRTHHVFTGKAYLDGGEVFLRLKLKRHRKTECEVDYVDSSVSNLHQLVGLFSQ